MCVCVCVCVWGGGGGGGGHITANVNCFNPVNIKLLCQKFEGCLAKSGDF